jgi:hypothetical protein
MAVFPTPLIAALIPGQSPPAVSMPIFLGMPFFLFALAIMIDIFPFSNV